MLGEIVGRAVNRQGWLDGVGKKLQQVAGALFDHLGPASRPVEDLLHGTPAGHPVHPAIVPIPIGAWTAVLALDYANKEGADLALDVGLVATLPAVLAGIADYRYTNGTMRRTGAAHALMNITGATLYALSSWRRHSGNRAGATTLSNVGYVFILAGGYLGGELSYSLGTMVNRNAWVTGETPFTPVMPLVDLEEDRPVRATTAKEDLVLVRRGERVYALANACAHLGGPLSEGKLVGDAIKCPWHGSEFRLEDGRAVCGPTAYNQPCYTARVHNNLVEVQLAGEYGEREPWYRVRGEWSAE